MEETERDDAGGGEDFVGAIFPQLKHFCLQLLQLCQNPNTTTNSSVALSQLLHLLRDSPPNSLQPFFDYALFPLLLLLDAAVDCRASAKNDEVSCVAEVVPRKVSDLVAEEVLHCLEQLLNKCALRSVDQMVVLLKKLSRGAMLSPLEASEEFREGIIKCFRALLLRLQLCTDDLCPCKQSHGLAELVAKDDYESLSNSVPKYDSEPEQCLLAFLQSDSASVAVGHWLSLLLKAADVEAARGHRGSATLRVEAFLTLRVLVAKVANADALAFFLPGVTSQIGKVLQMSKTMSSGAAGSSEALDQAIRSLAEFLAIVLADDQNLPGLNEFQSNNSVWYTSKEKSLASFLDELRDLPSKIQDAGDVVAKNLTEAVSKESSKSDNGLGRPLRVSCTKDWIVNTSAQINKLFSACFPFLSVHPSKKVRRGILSAIKTLLMTCRYTLRESRLLLLECLCVLACDDSQELCSPALVFLGSLFSSSMENMEQDVALILSRLVERIPHVVLGNDESIALSHARKLLVLMYFSGPQIVAAHLLHSPVAATRFLDVFAVCLSQNTTFAGSLDRLVLLKPSSAGYMHSIAEIEATRNAGSEQFEPIETKQLPFPPKDVSKAYQLPGMPPWFIYIGSQKLYQALSGVLRLVGLSLFAECGSEASLSLIIDIPLDWMRKLISEVRNRECSLESWESWYNRTGSGQLVRQASTAVCILNEMIYGLSDQAVVTFKTMFQHSNLRGEEIEGCNALMNAKPLEHEQVVPDRIFWRFCQDKRARNHLIDCIGRVLHEYLSPEVWALPLDHTDSLLQSNYGVVVEGIGIFCMCLGREFSSCGFLHSSLYLLLENLVCSNIKVRSASDAVLHTIAATLDYPTVGHLVLANSDYVIDSICRQLRHLDLNPHMPNVLAAMLSYIGIAHRILPLLEEPMRAVSLELEILGRYQHPDLTVPFLKAVLEISKASRHEAVTLPSQAEVLYKDVKSNLLDIENKIEKDTSFARYSMETDAEMGVCLNHFSREMQQWEQVLFKMDECRRYRRTVGSIAGSCVLAATPLITSSQQAACLIALDVIEDATVALAEVEDAYKNEKKTKEALDEIFDLYSFHSLRDSLDAAEDEAGENRLLPAVNKIWPFLIACVRNKNPVVVRRCLQTIRNVVQICGGDFFSRRFHTDGIHLWKLLSTSPFQGRPITKEDRVPLQLPYRSVSTAPSAAGDGVAERSEIKVQAAVLNMIADIAQNKRSASALETVLKKLSGLVVGVACSGVIGLRDAAINALSGLALMDPDLIWLLLADVYFSRREEEGEKDVVWLLPSHEFAEISQILPPPLTSKGYLYVEYGGQSHGFDIDFKAVEHVFKLMNTQLLFTHPDMECCRKEIL